MMLTEVTTVPDAALPVDAFKEFLRLGSGFSTDALQDDLLVATLRAALRAVEQRTGKMLFSRDFQWTASAWREADRQPLPAAPVSEIASVVIRDGDGSEALVSDGWSLQPDTHRPYLIAKGALPSIPSGYLAEIVFTAGFGPEWADIPADLKQAVMILAAYYYENRFQPQSNDQSMPLSVAQLIEPYRTVRMFHGGRSR